KKTWVAEMFMTEHEQERRREEQERQRGITPLLKAEIQRTNEIRGGVITGSIGIALLIFLKIFFQGLVASGDLPPDGVEIVSRIWIVGVIPLMVGLGLIVNGVLVSKRLVDMRRRELEGPPVGRLIDSDSPAITDRSGLSDWRERSPKSTSVTEHT